MASGNRYEKRQAVPRSKTQKRVGGVDQPRLCAARFAGLNITIGPLRRALSAVDRHGVPSTLTTIWIWFSLYFGCENAGPEVGPLAVRP